ncbi:hypothetical protein DFJ73DRAFT_659666 [Zopfochytrium polystomum]|nr:hypothetical protein DFJ73DRAFT_659666 [Zopfochytrium polystomum]
MNRDIAGGTIKRLEKTKTVSFLGGVCLLINAMTGAGIPFTASNFQTAGWIIPVALFFIFGTISGFSILFIVEALQAIPGNKHFQGTVEFATLINFYFGTWEHRIGQLLLYGAIQSQAIQNIILTAQTFDNILIEVFHTTCGITLPGNYTLANGLTQSVGFAGVCVHDVTGSGSPFPQSMLFTFGLGLVILFIIPFGMSNLDDNINLQIGAFMTTVVIIAQWMSSSIFAGFVKKRVQPVALNSGFQNILGNIILNFSATIYAPSWINLKRRTVNAQTVVWTTAGIAIILYTCVGLFPALGFPLCNLSNILPALMTSGKPLILSKITAYMFSFVMLLPAIPVSFIVAESNLTQSKMMPRWAAIFCCYILPWFFVIPLQSGNTLTTFINWTGMLLLSPVNFIIPFIIYLKCLRFRREYNRSRELTSKQRELLKTIHYASTTINKYIDARSAAANKATLAASAPVEVSGPLALGYSSRARPVRSSPGTASPPDEPMTSSDNLIVPAEFTFRRKSSLRRPSVLQAFPRTDKRSGTPVRSETLRSTDDTAGLTRRPSVPVIDVDPGSPRGPTGGFDDHFRKFSAGVFESGDRSGRPRPAAAKAAAAFWAATNETGFSFQSSARHPSLVPGPEEMAALEAVRERPASRSSPSRASTPQRPRSRDRTEVSLDRPGFGTIRSDEADPRSSMRSNDNPVARRTLSPPPRSQSTPGVLSVSFGRSSGRSSSVPRQNSLGILSEEPSAADAPVSHLVIPLRSEDSEGDLLQPLDDSLSPNAHPTLSIAGASEELEPWIFQDVPDPEEEDRVREAAHRSRLSDFESYGTIMDRFTRRSKTVGNSLMDRIGRSGGASPTRFRTRSRSRSPRRSNEDAHGSDPADVHLQPMAPAPSHAMLSPESAAASALSPSTHLPAPARSSPNSESHPTNSTPSPQPPTEDRPSPVNLQRRARLNRNQRAYTAPVAGANLSRGRTLPSNPAFVSPAFRSVPRWLGIRGRTLAVILIFVTSLLSVVNIGISIAFSFISQSSTCPPETAAPTTGSSPTDLNATSSAVVLGAGQAPWLPPLAVAVAVKPEGELPALVLPASFGANHLSGGAGAGAGKPAEVAIAARAKWGYE